MVKKKRDKELFFSVGQPKLNTQIQWAELYSKYCLNAIVFIIQRAAHASLSE